MERKPEIEERYRYGQCYPMAIALHRRLGWPIKTLTALRGRHDRKPHPVHSWVEAPDGRALDASGYRTEEDITGEYLRNREQFTVDSASFRASDSEEAYLKLILGLAGGGPEFEVWYRGELDRYVPEAEAVVSDYLEPRYRLSECCAAASEPALEF